MGLYLRQANAIAAVGLLQESIDFLFRIKKKLLANSRQMHWIDAKKSRTFGINRYKNNYYNLIIFSICSLFFFFFLQKNSSQKPIPPDPPDQDEDTQGFEPRAGNSVNQFTRGRNPKQNSPEPSPQPSVNDKSMVDKPAKKKMVTFKNVLETSDDVNIVKKVYNPNKVPSVPIIKVNKNRQDLSRYERMARGEIVMPSRLTEVLKNYSANHIDKLNLLTFKSAAFRATCSSDTQTKDLSRASSSSVSFDFKVNADDVGTGAASCEKRFILPKRSAHSCRVIKPNKKFLDDPSASGSMKISRKSNFLKKLNPLIADTGIVSDRDRDYKPIVHKTDNFINNTLSSQIGSSNLEEGDYNESEASQTASDGNATGK